MAITVDTIDRTTLEHLVEAGAVKGASIVGQPGGWGVVVHYGLTERVLAARRGAIRNFKKFETLVDYLKSIGLAKYQVDATEYEPAAPPSDRKRTDAAERMKDAHAAVAYRNWLEGKVSAARAGMADGSNKPIPDAEWATERAEWEREAHGA
ncbi:MAG TPA: hypothetical protein PLB25_00265 [Rhodoferax sp.]|nr:hypothetical protein [Rhodoferax sp.]